MLCLLKLTLLSLFLSLIRKTTILHTNLMILIDFTLMIEALRLRYNSLLAFVYFDLSPLNHFETRKDYM